MLNADIVKSLRPIYLAGTSSNKSRLDIKDRKELQKSDQKKKKKNPKKTNKQTKKQLTKNLAGRKRNSKLSSS